MKLKLSYTVFGFKSFSACVIVEGRVIQFIDLFIYSLIYGMLSGAQTIGLNDMMASK